MQRHLQILRFLRNWNQPKGYQKSFGKAQEKTAWIRSSNNQDYVYLTYWHCFHRFWRVTQTAKREVMTRRKRKGTSNLLSKPMDSSNLPKLHILTSWEDIVRTKLTNHSLRKTNKPAGREKNIHEMSKTLKPFWNVV